MTGRRHIDDDGQCAQDSSEQWHRLGSLIERMRDARDSSMDNLVIERRSHHHHRIVDQQRVDEGHRLPSSEDEHVDAEAVSASMRSMIAAKDDDESSAQERISGDSGILV